MSRELTRKEKTAIRSLVVTWCANYDREYGCLPLDSDSYMLGKCWTGSYCRYFRESVLPLDPALEASLMSEGQGRILRYARYAAGLFPRTGGRRTARRPVQRKPTAASNGNICGKSGVHPLTIKPAKPAYSKAFRGRFVVLPYHSTVWPRLPRCCQHPYSGTLGQFVPKSPLSERRNYAEVLPHQ